MQMSLSLPFYPLQTLMHIVHLSFFFEVTTNQSQVDESCLLPPRRSSLRTLLPLNSFTLAWNELSEWRLQQILREGLEKQNKWNVRGKRRKFKREFEEAKTDSLLLPGICLRRAHPSLDVETPRWRPCQWVVQPRHICSGDCRKLLLVSVWWIMTDRTSPEVPGHRVLLMVGLTQDTEYSWPSWQDIVGPSVPQVTSPGAC